MAPTLPVDFSGQRVSTKLSSQNNSTQMMGKTRKVSKGYSHGFVPDYRHAVDTTTHSEGFGSSIRIDTEITPSEDSCSLHMKSLPLNPDSSSQPFGVPVQVLSLSKLSNFERKDLESRLKHELEQVRTLQKNIGMVTVQKPIPEFSRSMSLPMTKRKAPPGRNGGSRSKKTGSGSTRVLPPTSGTGYPMLMKQCETVLKGLMGHAFGWVFNTPVDVVALKIPDYYTVIQHPMDLGTVKTKLMSGKYQDPCGFAGDVRLTFSNAMTYNPRGNDVHTMAETLGKFFEVRWKAIEKKLESVAIPVRQNVLETEVIPMPPFKKKKTVSNEIIQKEEEVVVKRKMSDAEKLKISSELENSISDLPEKIIDFLKENSSNGNGGMDDEIEIDIDSLNDDTLFKLRKLLDDFLLEKQNNTVTKHDTCEIEIQNESGFSNSSMQEHKGNDVNNEEDVDIGVDEVPSTRVEIEIEKDTAVRNNNNSSSSSSSASGSSSSDSDSGSSSGSESDDAKTSTILNNVKETMGNEVNTEQIPVPNDAKGNNNNNEDQKFQSGEVEGRKEGESNESGPCQSERQVSPDKLYRAALLRSRFADTILKAQEKTTGKVEEQDRERLRLEKEEVEKRRKQEMARLEAEAKAAEEARKKAEVEAKRLREAEREAARQAIQKMEKVVDINDGSGFLEDLEMLSVAPTQPLESLVDETNDTFNFDGKKNPLEQLGLYMKDDDDEDGVDPEEGEID